MGWFYAPLYSFPLASYVTYMLDGAGVLQRSNGVSGEERERREMDQRAADRARQAASVAVAHFAPRLLSMSSIY